MLSLLANEATERPTLVTLRLPNSFYYGLGMFWLLAPLLPRLVTKEKDYGIPV